MPTTLDPRRWRALAVLAVAQFMVVLDVTIVNVALPSIRTDLGFAAEDLQWVVNAYTLAFGGLLLLGGRVADLLGRRRIFLAGLALFGLASLAGGLTTSSGGLVAARAVQGVGAAMLSPSALALVTTAFTDTRERSTALGVWASLAGLGGTVGVVSGGALVDALGWEWVFFVNVPIAVLVAPFALRLVRESRAEGAAGTYDVAGALTATLGLLALVYGVIRTDRLGWGAPEVLALFAAAVALLGAFVAVESRSQAPLVPLGMLRRRSVAVGNLVQLVNGAGFIAMFFLTTLYLQNVLGMSALTSGLAFVPMGVAAIGGAVAASVLVNRVGTVPVLLAGALGSAGGLALLSGISAGGSYVTDVLPGIVLFGLAIPFAGVPATITAVSGIEGERAGVASGLVNTSYQVGAAIGLAALTTFATTRTADLLGSGAAQADALARGFGHALAIGAGVAAVNVLLGLLAAPRLRPGGQEAAPGAVAVVH